MKWFTGDIAQAVNLAKNSGAVFVVYSEGEWIRLLSRKQFCEEIFPGNDENSKQLTELINSDSVAARLESKSFVAIKIQSDKEEYMNFAKICEFSFFEDT